MYYIAKLIWKNMLNRVQYNVEIIQDLGIYKKIAKCRTAALNAVAPMAQQGV